MHTKGRRAGKVQAQKANAKGQRDIQARAGEQPRGTPESQMFKDKQQADMHAKGRRAAKMQV